MSQLTLVVGSKNFSSWSLRPWLALKMTGQPFREEVIQLRRPDTKDQILRFSPSGKVPALIDGDLTLWDSLAICEYLAETFPEAGLWPKEAKARAVARAVSAEMHAGFATLRQMLPMDIVANKAGFAVPAEAQADIDRIQALWAECRIRFGAGGPYLFGGFSLADVMYAPVVTRFTTYGVAMNPVSKVYAEAIWALPAMQEWKAAAALEAPV